MVSLLEYASKKYDDIAKLSFFEWKIDHADALTIAKEIRRLTTRYDFCTNKIVKQNRRAIPVAKTLKKLYPALADQAVLNLYIYRRRKAETIESARRGDYKIGEQEACVIGASICNKLDGLENGIEMAQTIFLKMPRSFIRHLIKRRENDDLDYGWFAELNSEFDDKTRAEMISNHKALMALKIINRRLGMINESKKFYRVWNEFCKLNGVEPSFPD